MTETDHHDLEVHEDVRTLLERWERQGLVSETQVEQIVAFEQAAPPPRREGRLAVEALAYLGGVLSLAAALLLVQIVWHDLATGARLAIPLVASLALLLAGALVPGGAPERVRLRSVLWLLATGAWLAAAAVVGDQMLGWDGEETVLLTGLAGVALALPLYLRARTEAQQLGLFVSLAMSAGAIGAQAHWDEPTLIGLGVWLVALAWFVLGELQVLRPAVAVRLTSSVALVAASVMMQQSLGGQGAALVTIVLLFVWGVRDDSLGLLAVGAVGTLIMVPGAITYWFPDDVGISVPLTLLAIGAGLVSMAMLVTRRRLRRAGSRH
jgi:hypothetical protein